MEIQIDAGGVAKLTSFTRHQVAHVNTTSEHARGLFTSAAIIADRGASLVSKQLHRLGDELQEDASQAVNGLLNLCEALDNASRLFMTYEDDASTQYIDQPEMGSAGPRVV